MGVGRSLAKQSWRIALESAESERDALRALVREMADVLESVTAKLDGARHHIEHGYFCGWRRNEPCDCGANKASADTFEALTSARALLARAREACQ